MSPCTIVMRSGEVPSSSATICDSVVRKPWPRFPEIELDLGVSDRPVDLIGEGVSINITLLFAQDVYEKVAEAYISGLEKFAASGGDLSIYDEHNAHAELVVDPTGVANAPFLIQHVDLGRALGAGSDVVFDGVPVTNVPWSLADEVSLWVAP